MDRAGSVLDRGERLRLARRDAQRQRRHLRIVRQVGSLRLGDARGHLAQKVGVLVGLLPRVRNDFRARRELQIAHVVVEPEWDDRLGYRDLTVLLERDGKEAVPAVRSHAADRVQERELPAAQHRHQMHLERRSGLMIEVDADDPGPVRRQPREDPNDRPGALRVEDHRLPPDQPRLEAQMTQPVDVVEPVAVVSHGRVRRKRTAAREQLMSEIGVREPRERLEISHPAEQRVEPNDVVGSVDSDAAVLTPGRFGDDDKADRDRQGPRAEQAGRPATGRRTQTQIDNRRHGHGEVPR